MTPEQVAVLVFEREHETTPAGPKAVAVHDRWGWTITAYTQRLNAVLDHPQAVAVDPMLVHRLRRVRDARRRGR